MLFSVFCYSLTFTYTFGKVSPWKRNLQDSYWNVTKSSSYLIEFKEKTSDIECTGKVLRILLLILHMAFRLCYCVIALEVCKVFYEWSCTSFCECSIYSFSFLLVLKFRAWFRVYIFDVTVIRKNMNHKNYRHWHILLAKL